MLFRWRIARLYRRRVDSSLKFVDWSINGHEKLFFCFSNLHNAQFPGVVLHHSWLFHHTHWTEDRPIRSHRILVIDYWNFKPWLTITLRDGVKVGRGPASCSFWRCFRLLSVFFLSLTCCKSALNVSLRLLWICWSSSILRRLVKKTYLIKNTFLFKFTHLGLN